MGRMFHYTICNQADSAIFQKQCQALEERIPGLRKKLFLHDVDGTLIQIYHHVRGEIVVKRDVPVDAVYVDSDFNLLPYFNVT